MIYTVTLNPAVDKTVTVNDFTIDEVNRAAEVRQDPGGKGINVSKTVKALGGESVAYAILGGSAGEFIERALTEARIACHATRAAGETRTNTKIVDPVRDTFTDVNESGTPVTATLLNGMRDTLVANLHEGDIVVLSGSLPAGAPADTYATWCAACKGTGAKVFLDADGAPMAEGIKAAPYLAKPNEVELARILGRELADDAAIVAAARELIAQGVERVMVSMGGDGAIFVTAEQALRLHQPKVKVLSTVGAGDSVVAALAYAENEGLDLEGTLRLAMATGPATVMRPGTEPCHRDDVDRFLSEVVIEEL